MCASTGESEVVRTLSSAVLLDRCDVRSCLRSCEIGFKRSVRRRFHRPNGRGEWLPLVHDLIFQDHERDPDVSSRVKRGNEVLGRLKSQGDVVAGDIAIEK